MSRRPTPFDLLATLDNLSERIRLDDVRAAVMDLVEVAEAANAIRVDMALGVHNAGHVIALQAALDRPSVIVAMSRAGGDA